MNIIENFNYLVENFDTELAEQTLILFCQHFQTSTSVPIDEETRKKIFKVLKTEYIYKEQDPSDGQGYAFNTIRILLRQPISLETIVKNKVVQHIVKIINQKNLPKFVCDEAYKCLVNLLHHSQIVRSYFATLLNQDDFPQFIQSLSEKNLEMIFLKSRLIFYSTFDQDSSVLVFKNIKNQIFGIIEVLFSFKT
jgi:hypothetical protein